MDSVDKIWMEIKDWILGALVYKESKEEKKNRI